MRSSSSRSITCMAQRASRLGLTRKARQMARIWSSMCEADPVVTLRQHSGITASGNPPKYAGSGPQQLAGPGAPGALVAQPDVPPLRVALPELDLPGGQRVEGPGGCYQLGIGENPGVRRPEGPVELGRVA